MFYFLSEILLLLEIKLVSSLSPVEISITFERLEDLCSLIFMRVEKWMEHEL